MDNHIYLEESDMHHIKNVMRMNKNDKIECIYNKELYICRILDVNLNKFPIIEKIVENNELGIDLTIAIALVKEQKMDLILQKLTELGVTKIIPLKTKRSIVKLDEKRFQKKKIRWQTICKEASEQSKRNIVPEITDIKTLEQLSEEESDLKLLCSPNAKKLVNNYLQSNNNCAKMIFVIGSEGGLTEQEEKYLESIGYTLVSLGKRILRVETAAIYVASIVSYSNWSE